jgi:hypothetical protein
MNSSEPNERFFEDLASAFDDDAAESAMPSKLKAKAYSALVNRQQESGPLLGLRDTYAEGRGLCVHEHLVRIAPVGTKAQQFNCCSICHARVLGEALENPPIYWGNCPYAGFKRS